MGDRNVDTIGVGHVRVEEDKPILYILPLVRLAGESSGDLTCVCGGRRGGSAASRAQALGEGGGWEGGEISSAGATQGGGGTERQRRAGLEKAGASWSRAAFTAELGPSLLSLSSAPAPGQQR